MVPSEKKQEEKTNAAQPDEAGFISKHKKELLYILAISVIVGFLVYLETNLPFFRKFMPVLDNKLLIAILNLNFLLILLLIFLATRIILKTYIEKKRGIWGSGLKTKLTVTIFSVSIISSTVLFILTTWFFYISMDKWFSQKVEDAVESARELSDFYYENLFSRYEKMGNQLAATIRDRGMLEKDKELAAFIKKEGKSNFLGYLAVLDVAGKPVKASGALTEQMNEILAEKSKSFLKNRQARQFAPLKDGELLVFLTPLADETGQLKGLLFLGEKIRVKGTQSMKQITKIHTEFKEARPLKKILKYSFIIPLFLITILSIFFSIWIGIKMATEIAVPLERVKEGAAIIAKGRFDISLEDRGKDEIGTLVSAFNRMARELKIAKDEIEEKRKYMEVILENVATGIITTDVKGNLLLMNRAAKDILKVETGDWFGIPLRNIVGEDFKRIIRSFLKGIKEGANESMSKEVRLTLRNQTIFLRVSLTVLRDESSRTEGYIATFDDITHIVRAEKLATWQEIAKRLTHEIKNPLTPIKLSAERLRRRLLPNAEGREKEVLDETTSVILSASDDITGMVNELAKLTHTAAVRTVEDVNNVIDETIGIYRNLCPNISFDHLQVAVPPFSMDRDKIKRALINLITNSINAINSDPGTIRIATRFDKKRGVTWIEVTDTGPGIRDEDKSRVFDPYFTTNPEGTGLGLAIVNSIILEHGGRINVEDNEPRGTRMVIELPVVEA
jgi:two-component system nitrogen regulation sensor histidine kinase NtrY